jgi:hypothetical protein
MYKRFTKLINVTSPEYKCSSRIQNHPVPSAGNVVFAPQAFHNLTGCTLAPGRKSKLLHRRFHKIIEEGNSIAAHGGSIRWVDLARLVNAFLQKPFQKCFLTK